VRNSETALVRSILQALQLRGVWCWRLNSGSVHREGLHYLGAPAGSPDIMGVIPPRMGPHGLPLEPSGRLFGLEAKTKTGKLLASQSRWHAKAIQHGVAVGVVRDVKSAVEMVEAWRGGSHE
jgi:hypothetical protein